MLRLPLRTLPPHVAATLQAYENEVLAEPDYPARVALAKQRFKQRNTATNATFREIRNTLGEMCAGARRCMYCEDSMADEVEHHRPKDLYPGQVFSWNNYLYACGPCNSPKQNKFAIIDARQQRIDVARKKGDPIVPPIPGATALLDPRVDDPLDFLMLDIAGNTFLFVAIPGLPVVETLRAEYTIELLKLNDRDPLPRARREAFHNYRARLVEYVSKAEAGASQSELHLLVDALQRMGHPTVWQEMKRQRTLIPELNTLFTQASQALTW
ncbi:MAG: hypothetical protein JNK87_04495 [Bryobacterales bacterium]|nr:hypothetical protein [Bryobacterales bacterium]